MDDSGLGDIRAPCGGGYRRPDDNNQEEAQTVTMFVVHSVMLY